MEQDDIKWFVMNGELFFHQTGTQHTISLYNHVAKMTLANYMDLASPRARPVWDEAVLVTLTMCPWSGRTKRRLSRDFRRPSDALDYIYRQLYINHLYYTLPWDKSTLARTIDDIPPSNQWTGIFTRVLPTMDMAEYRKVMDLSLNHFHDRRAQLLRGALERPQHYHNPRLLLARFHAQYQFSPLPEYLRPVAAVEQPEGWT